MNETGCDECSSNDVSILIVNLDYTGSDGHI
jgi:hypothetical protein